MPILIHGRRLIAMVSLLWLGACLPILHEPLVEKGSVAADPALIGVWQLEAGDQGRVHAYVAKLEQGGLEVVLVGIGSGEDGLNVQYYRAITAEIAGKNWISLQARITAGHDMIEPGHQLFGSGWIPIRYEVAKGGKTARYWLPKERPFRFARDNGDLMGEQRENYWIFTSDQELMKAFVAELRSEDFHSPQALQKLD